MENCFYRRRNTWAGEGRGRRDTWGNSCAYYTTRPDKLCETCDDTGSRNYQRETHSLGKLHTPYYTIITSPLYAAPVPYPILLAVPQTLIGLHSGYARRPPFHGVSRLVRVLSRTSLGPRDELLGCWLGNHSLRSDPFRQLLLLEHRRGLESELGDRLVLERLEEALGHHHVLLVRGRGARRLGSGRTRFSRFVFKNLQVRTRLRPPHIGEKGQNHVEWELTLEVPVSWWIHLPYIPKISLNASVPHHIVDVIVLVQFVVHVIHL